MKQKDYYDESYLVLLAEKINAVLPSFKSDQFVANLKNKLNDKALFDRFDLIVFEMEKCLPDDYPYTIAAFFNLLGPELETSTGMFSQGWWLWPIGRYVEKNGVKDWQASMGFIKELTKRFTGEFAIRPLLQTYPHETLLVMQEWSTNPNVHVRRLASEGLRIRLPWAQKMHVFLDEFALCKQILTNLKDDPDRFVQKSVGNNLNDLFKDAPEKASEIIEGWRKQPLSAAATWVIAHGMRNVNRAQKAL